MCVCNTNQDGYLTLAVAIVYQAALDYETAWKHFKRTGERTERLDECEEFFKSRWGRQCSFGKAEFIMESIQKGVPVYIDGKILRGEKHKFITFNGETKRMSDWARHLGITTTALSKRLKRGWTIEEALTTEGGKSRAKKYKAV